MSAKVTHQAICITDEDGDKLEVWRGGRLGPWAASSESSGHTVISHLDRDDLTALRDWITDQLGEPDSEPAPVATIQEPGPDHAADARLQALRFIQATTRDNADIPALLGRASTVAAYLHDGAVPESESEPQGPIVLTNDDLSIARRKWIGKASRIRSDLASFDDGWQAACDLLAKKQRKAYP